MPASENDDHARDHDSSRNSRVCRHVQKCAPDIQVSFSSGEKQHCCRAIDHDTDGRDDHYSSAANFPRTSESAYRFPCDAANCDQQKDRVRDGSEDRRATESIGAAWSRLRPGEMTCAPCKKQAEQVT